jgi:hypothetical protein
LRIVNRDRYGEGGGFGNHHSEKLLRKEIMIETLLAALRQWKCPACGGKGIYQQDARGRKIREAEGKPIDPKYQPDPVVCKVCKGDGLHPIASEAIATAEKEVKEVKCS